MRRDIAIARALESLSYENGNLPPNISLKWEGRPAIDPLSFHHVIPAKAVRRRGWRRVWHEEPGVGSPLVLLRERDNDDFVGKIGEILPVTAVLDQTASGFGLTLHDSIAPGSATTTHRGQAIARDYTAPLAYLLRRDDLMPELRALFRSGRFLDDLGLYRLSPYDPDKIPVIFVHGLKSSPQVWANLVNDLKATPEIRDRFQFWVFSYPTGIPILYSAMRLRQELQTMRKHYDPPGSNPNMNNIVLVGHSMGGILSRLMISGSSERLLAWIPKPIDDLKLPPELQKLSRELMVFEPQPYIKRALYIATPHRGSEVAGLRIVRRATSFIRVPRELRSAALTALRLNPDLALIPDATLDSLNSIENLRPGSRFMEAMADQPTAPGIPYHSIIGICEESRGKPLEQTDDSLVTYASAHLDGAESELTVAAPHKAFDNPESIAEVIRILKLHR